jgi:LPLT family lysophospholipid transporter-like MFS transporter
MKPARNYPLLLASQFWSAFGDNFILVVILGPIMNQLKDGKISAQTQSLDNIYYTSLLFVPYVLLAPVAGYLNDCFAKNRWLLGGNLIKLIGTCITALGLTGVPVWQAAGYFVVGIGACVYSPAKYGILPEILPNERLVKANGMMEFLTLVAILAGSISGALAFDHMSLVTCYLLVAGIYALSLALNLFMSQTPSYPEVRMRDSVSGFFHNAGELFSQRRLARILMGTAMFWICGAILKMNFQPWGQQVLKLTTMTQINLLGLWLSHENFFFRFLLQVLVPLPGLQSGRAETPGPVLLIPNHFPGSTGCFSGSAWMTIGSSSLRASRRRRAGCIGG